MSARRAAFALALVLLSAAALTACGPIPEAPDSSRRAWRGPTDTVSSQGITVYDRREIAQKVEFPTCLYVGDAVFRYDEVRPTPGGGALPPGMLDTGYGLDRWRLVAPAGVLEEQPVLYVTARGSTGIIAQYPRREGSPRC